MPLRIEAQAEPIPGYKLIERLGSGGFGEVWKAEAPGGLFKAIKFVQRDTGLEQSCVLAGGPDPDKSRADQEWKSLIRVKSVRHPFILLLDRFENIENYLVIVMELADRTLADRFKECRASGIPGLPREELLNYLAEAAEVLDLMNSQYQLQHLDIKPQNLFLVHNHIKVADFGLVKDTTGGVKLMTITGGVTPVYAAPETFDGKFSRYSDQYSLGIVYQEMLTGSRPFTGTSMKQLILQHMQNAHDLTPLPVNDRAIIARALSKNPEDRYGTCVELIEHLRRATLKLSPGGELPPPPKAGPLPLDRQFPTVRTIGARGASGPIKPASPDFSEAGFLGHGTAAAPLSAPAAPPVSVPPPLAGESILKTSPPVSVRRKERAPRPVTQDQLPGIVQPALIIGIGKLGVDTLAHVRQRITTEFGSPNAIPQVRLIALDTDVNTLQQAVAVNSRSALRTQETLLARLQRPSHYLKTRDGNLATDSWLNPKLLHRIPREQTNAGLRALGRLAFVDNYKPIAKRLEGELATLCSQDTQPPSDSVHDLGVRSHRPRVYIVTSLTGNTGSGMFIDVAYLVRQLLTDLHQDDAEIVGVFYVPTTRRDQSTAPPLANAYAALTELRHYCQPTAVFSAHYETAASVQKGIRVSTVGPAYQRCILLPLPELRGKRTSDNSAVAARAGDFLFRDVATFLGQAIDEQRANRLRLIDPKSTATPLLQAIGMSRIHWPRHALLDECSRRLSNRLVARWMSKDAKSNASAIHVWSAEQWEALGMRPETLIERFKQLAEESLQKRPETLLAEIVALMQQLLAGVEKSKTQVPVQLTPVVQAMECLERILGIPEDGRPSSKANLDVSMIERALDESAHLIADECEQRLAELAVAILEDPNYRLASAEEALRQFSILVEQSLKSQETLARELNENGAQLYKRIQKLIDSYVPAPGATSSQWTLVAKKTANGSQPPNTPEIIDLVRNYTKVRFHSLVLTHLNRLYLGLRGHLSDQVREVGFCRARIGELQALLVPPAIADKHATGPADCSLFPPGCVDLKEAIEQLSTTINTEDLLAFDHRIQVWIKEHCRALLEICMGSSTTVKNLAPAMLQEAEAYLGDRLQGVSVTEMYLTRKQAEYEADTADDMIFDDLQRYLDNATPDIGRPTDDSEITVISLPNDEYGQHLEKLLSKKLTNVKILLTDAPDEMLFYHEVVNIQWKDLEQFGPIAAEAYHQRCVADPATLHTREDVFDWQLIAESR